MKKVFLLCAAVCFMSVGLMGQTLQVEEIVFLPDSIRPGGIQGDVTDEPLEQQSAPVTLTAALQSSSTSGIPDVIFPSPEIATLFRYYEYAVNHSSGLPNIDIPVYTIQYGPLTVPVSISYDASGRRSGEKTGPVGLGWALNTGGMISRIINGKADEMSSRPNELNQQITAATIMQYIGSGTPYQRQTGFNLMRDIYEHLPSAMDSEYDIFTYVIPGHTGKFIINPNDQAVPLNSNSPVSISVIKNGFNLTFSITDDKGITYTFTQVEFCATVGNSMTPTAWGISSIQSPGGKYTITFTYFNSTQYNTSAQLFLNIRDANKKTPYPEPGNQAIPNPNAYYSDNTFSASAGPYYNKRLSEIDFVTGKLSFEMEKPAGVVVDDSKIKNITITVNNAFFRKCVFNTSLLDNAGYYKLDNLAWVDSNNLTQEQHRFEYNSSSVTSRNSPVDHWGFRNNGGNTFSNATAGLPGITVLTNDMGAKTFGTPNIREPNINYTQQGVLKKIIYPTGGYTEFTYEANKYLAPGNTVKTGGGLRIKEITTTESTGSHPIRKTYEYDEGYLKYTPAQMNYVSDNYTYIEVDNDFVIYNSSKRYIFSPTFSGDISFLAGLPVFYRRVAEYTNQWVAGQSTKTIYTYNNHYTNTQTGYCGTQVSGYFPAGSNFQFEEHAGGLAYSMIYCSRYDHFWRNTQPVTKEEFANNGDGTYRPVRTTTYNYVETPLQDINSIKVRKNVRTSNEQAEEYMGHFSTISVYSCVDYSIASGKVELKNITQTNHFPGGNDMVETRSFDYNNLGLVTQSSLVNSSGDTFKEKTSYLEAQNRTYGFPVKKETYNNNTFVQSLEINYDNILLKPKEYYSRHGLSPRELRVKYAELDQYGNPVHVVTEGVQHTIYIWGYKGQYPVARIETGSGTASYADIKAKLGAANVAILDANPTGQQVRDMFSALRNRDDMKGSMVSCYTYTPLVGMTSETDPSGRTVFYEYDGFGRMARVKDENGKVLKEHKYNYAQPLP